MGPADDAGERAADRAVVGHIRPARGQAQSVSPTSPAAPPSVYAALATPGRPLDARTRAYFEPRVGAGLGAVRIHDGAAATASASELSARAYTVGADIVLGGGYRHDDPDARTVLAHELAHVVQADGEPALRRYPMCKRLLTTSVAGPFVAEGSVQEFLADELETVGEAERELPVPGGSAAPWRTEGPSGWDDSVIEPQLLDEWIRGRVDLALWTGELALEFLEVKRASWAGAEFAENQLVNYVDKANDSIREVERLWRRRTGNGNAHIMSVRPMPTERYTPPPGPVDVDGQDVMLSWCRPGVMVFKPIDTENRDLLYCGISDEERTDAFIERLLGQAEDIVAQALRRRLRERFPSDPVNIRPLLDAIREKLAATIRWLLSESIKAVCEAALEVTLAAVLDQLRKLLRSGDLIDGLLVKLTPQGEGVDLHLGEAAARTAQVITIGTILYELGSLTLALI